MACPFAVPPFAGQAVALRVITSSSNAYYHLYNDHLGSLAAIGNSSGSLVSGSRAYYQPFGSYRGTAPTQTLTDRQFTSQKENLELGLYCYNARYYAPGLGRFITADTIVPHPQNPQSFNRYSYVSNRPINFKDPTGHCAERGSSQEADDCWDYLENEFCSGIDCGDLGWERWILNHGLFSKRDLILIRESLFSTKNALQAVGIADWQSVLPSNLLFDRNFGDLVQGAYDYTNQRLTLYSGLLTEESDIAIVFSIIHELGHAIDHKTAGDVAFALGDSILGQSAFNEHGLIAGYNCMRNYACSDVQEGWADAFATFVIGTYGAFLGNWDMEFVVNEEFFYSQSIGVFGRTRYYMDWSDIGNTIEDVTHALDVNIDQ